MSSVNCLGPGPARYLLPNMTGCQGHDFSRKTWPAYSFGRKVGTCKSTLHGLINIIVIIALFPQIGFGKTDSPGPCHFIDPTVTRSGKDGTPHYSLYARSKDLCKLQ